MSAALCEEYDHAASMRWTASGDVEWDQRPARCHISVELASVSEARAYIESTYTLTPGCREGVLHADERTGHE